MFFKFRVLLFAVTLSIISIVDSTPFTNAETVYVTHAPWYLQIKTQVPSEVICCGTLISKTHILTSAGCANLQLQSDSITLLHKGKETTYYVKRYVRHPKYPEDHINYDVAIVTLYQSVETSEELKYIRWNRNDISVTGRSLQMIGSLPKTTNNIKSFWRSFWRTYEVGYGTVMTQDRCNENELSPRGIISNSSHCLEFHGNSVPQQKDTGTGVVIYGRQVLLMGVLTQFGNGKGISIRTAFVADFILEEMGEGVEMCYDLQPCI